MPVIRRTRVDASGNMGIGTNTPQAKLDVRGNALIEGNILPSANTIYDLGAPSQRWNDLYLSGTTIDLSGTLLSRHTDGSLMIHDSNNLMLGVTCGNLTVNGTTTTVNSTTLTVEDPIVSLGSDLSDNKDRGVEFRYNDGSSRVGFFGYDNSTGNFTFLKDASNTSEVFVGTKGTIDISSVNVLDGTATNPSLTFSNDTNTGLYRAGTDTLGIVTGGYERVRVDASGNVGIGSSAPSQRLDVSGNSYFRGNVTANGNVGIGTSLPTQTLDVSGNASFTGNVTASGNVGIGTSAPSSTLDVNGSFKVTPYVSSQPFFVRSNETIGANTCTAAINLNIGGGGTDAGYSICTDSSGNLYVTGYYTSGSTVTVPNLDGTNSTKTLPNTYGYIDMFILKYANDTSGTCIAAIHLSGIDDGTDIGYSVCTDPSGNLYVTGQYTSYDGLSVPNLDGTSSGKTLPPNDAIATDTFILKYANDASGTCVSAITLNGTSTDEGLSVCTDPFGNLYVTGRYQSTAAVTVPNLDGTSSGKTLATSTGGFDAFILKYANDASGTCVGAVTLNGTSIDEGRAICTDLSGNLYITGRYGSTTTLTIPNLDGTSSTKTFASFTGSAAFILKYNTNGTCVAAVQFNGTGRSVTTDLYGNLYVTGNYISTTTVNVPNLDGTNSGKSLVTASNFDIFILKYDTSGICIAAVGLKGTHIDIGHSVCTDLYGYLYVTGSYQTTATVTVPNLDGTSSGKTLDTTGSSIGVNMFLLKYNANGDCMSAIQLKREIGNTSDIGYSVCTDPYGNLYVTGQYGSTLVLTSTTVPNLDGSSSGKFLPPIESSTDAFILKYSADQPLSLVGINKTDPQSALDVSGNIYMSDGTAAAPVLTFRSDTNTGFYRAGTDILGIVTGGAERVRVEANGNVGIGTSVPLQQLDVSGNSYFRGNVGIGSSAPSAQLDVSGNIYMSNGTAAAPVLAFGSNPNTGFYRPGTDTLGIVTGGSERVRVNANGNVGIGVGNPQAALDIGGQLRIENASSHSCIFRCNYPTTYGWKIRTVDRGMGIDLDIIGTNGTDIETDILSLSITETGRVPRWNGYTIYHAGNSGPITVVSSININLSANTWYAIANLEGYDGTYVLQVRWGSGIVPGGTQYFWNGYASGIISLDNGQVYNTAPEELLSLNYTNHHRNAENFSFKLDSDNSNGAYGNQTLYIKHSIAMTVSSISVKLRYMI